jgi:surface protein
MHFTTLAGSVDYVGTQGDQILLSNGTIVNITVTNATVTFNAPAGKHKVKLVESVGRSSYVSVGGVALVELHNFPTLSTVTKFNFATNKYNALPNLTKVPDFLPSNITNMSHMFYQASSFNQALNNWNVSNVTNMIRMFYNASAFNQYLSMWCVSKITNIPDSFNGGAPLLVGAKLPRWGTCPAP